LKTDSFHKTKNKFFPLDTSMALPRGSSLEEDAPFVKIKKHKNTEFLVSIIIMLPSKLDDYTPEFSEMPFNDEDGVNSPYLRYSGISIVEKEKIISCRTFDIIYYINDVEENVPYLITFCYEVTSTGSFNKEMHTDAIIVKGINKIVRDLKSEPIRPNPETPRGTVTTSTES
jgi:hypothetical protein